MSSGNKSRMYVSSGIETTAGVAATLNKTFNVIECDVIFQEDQSKSEEVSGYLNSVELIRESIRSGGNISKHLNPDFAAWLGKMLFGASPTSALVAPSSTVYEHTFDTFTSEPATFTLMKKLATISNYTEKFAGNGITGLSVKSGKGRIGITAKVEGMGVYTRGASEPVGVTPIITSDETSLLGVNSNLLIDGVAVTSGTLEQGWSLDFNPGAKLAATAGSDDGSITRFDYDGDHTVTASFTLYQRDTTYLADFAAGTFHTFEFRCQGPTIDAGNSLKSLVAFKLMNARVVNDWRSAIRGKGSFRVPITIAGIADTSTGKDFTLRVRNLQTSY